MSRISRVLREGEDGHGGRSLLFYCRGCEMAHAIGVGAGPEPRWGYNQNADQPTFTPSILVKWDQAGKEQVCHSFVRHGRIEYLGDSTHEFAGQTIDLPEFRWGEDDPDEETEA